MQLGTKVQKSEPIDVSDFYGVSNLKNQRRVVSKIITAIIKQTTKEIAIDVNDYNFENPEVHQELLHNIYSFYTD